MTDLTEDGNLIHQVLQGVLFALRILLKIYLQLLCSNLVAFPACNGHCALAGGTKFLLYDDFLGVHQQGQVSEVTGDRCKIHLLGKTSFGIRTTLGTH